MIKYYLRVDLLPPAEKPRANLSLYTENHLKLIHLIRKFQEQTKLSLQDIGEVFRTANYDANAIEIQLLSAQYSVGDDNIIPLKNYPQNTHSLDFPAEFLQQLAKTSLLENPGQLAQDQDQLAGLLWAAHNAGVPLAFFESAQEKLAELADFEVKTLIAIKRPDLSFNDMLSNVTDVNRIINRWMVSEKSRQIRSQFQRVIDNSERAISTLLDAIYQPSAIFRERHNIDQILSNVSLELSNGPPDIEQTHVLCFACMLLGDYERAITIAQTTPQKPIITALIALAHGLQNNVDLAFEYGSQLEDSQDKHPVILQARMLSLLLKASKQGGVADTTELMKSAAEIFLELAQDPSLEEPEAILTLARANVAFPDFANSQPQAIKALQVLLQRLEQNTVELSNVSVADLRESLLTVYRINALYYMGVLLSMAGEHDKARQFFEQLIQLDPASNFGQKAFLQLGVCQK
ncbi:MAG: tetratricopeptide (TPR) repeat protein [Halioglobus sp.]|jgi:tetratricopeptide (TPR) repeat protein